MARPNQDPKYLAILQDYYTEHRLIPSYAAISTLLGFSTKTAAATLVGRLQRAGYLKRAPDKRLSPTDRFFERPQVIGSVRAGLPEATFDSSVDLVNLDRLLVHKPSLTFFIPIRGESMRDAGLLDGDTAVCERRQQAQVGDIVVASIGNELTIKTLAKEGKRHVLHAANPDYPILRPDPLEIIAVVTGSFRSYRR